MEVIEHGGLDGKVKVLMSWKVRPVWAPVIEGHVFPRDYDVVHS